jgi:hypothetical protein
MNNTLVHWLVAPLHSAFSWEKNLKKNPPKNFQYNFQKKSPKNFSKKKFPKKIFQTNFQKKKKPLMPKLLRM